MYCQKCGCKNKDEAIFCKECGTKLRSELSVSVPKKRIIGAAAGAAIIIAIVIAVMMNTNATINLNEYVDVSFDGYDGYGHTYVTIDWDEIQNKYGSEVSYTKDAKSKYGSMLTYMPFVETMRGYVSISGPNQAAELSNGDHVVYTWNINEEELSRYLDCKIVYEDMSVTVSGLEKIDEFDPFEDLSVSFSGIEPEGRVLTEYSGDILSNYDFYCEQESGLKNGDVITVYLRENDTRSYVENYGTIPSATKKVYTVEGVGRYASKLSEIDESSMALIQGKARSIVSDYTSGWLPEATVDSVSYIGTYLEATGKTDSYIYNVLGVVYKIESHVQAANDYESVQATVYYDIRFYNMLIDGDGRCEIDLDYYDTPDDGFIKEAYYGDDPYDYNSYYYYGYELLNELVQKRSEDCLGYYTIEWNLSDVEIPSEDMGEYLCAYSSERVMTEYEVEDYMNADYLSYNFPGNITIIQMIINEMYARHGYAFSDEGLTNYFNQKEWYRSIESKSDDMNQVYDSMSEIEHANITLLQQYR